MNSEELDRIQIELNLTLPEYFRLAAELGQLDTLLNCDCGSIIAINTAFRSGEFGEESWPANLLAFANDPAGDFYCLDLSSSESNVLIRDHETLSVNIEANNFTEWLALQR